MRICFIGFFPDRIGLRGPAFSNAPSDKVYFGIIQGNLDSEKILSGRHRTDVAQT